MFKRIANSRYTDRKQSSQCDPEVMNSDVMNECEYQSNRFNAEPKHSYTVV